MHLIWKADFESEAFYTRALVENPKALSNLKLLAGDSLVGKFPFLRVEIISSYPPADYFNAGPLFIISQKLREIFDKFEVPVEYFPIAVTKDLKESLDNYYFANILKHVACLDYQRSVYSRDGEFVDTIEKLVINEEVAADYPLFRLGKCYDVVVLVSTELSQAICNAGMTGVKFIRDCDWQW